MLTQRHEDSIAEDQHAAHDRSLLNQLRRSKQREPGGMEPHDYVNRATKKRRPVLLAAIILLSILVVSLHALGGMLLLKTGLGESNHYNPRGSNRPSPWCCALQTVPQLNPQESA